MKRTLETAAVKEMTAVREMTVAGEMTAKRRIYAREEVCVGCRLCEVYCITAHSPYRDNIVKAFRKTVPRPVARILVEECKPVSFGLQCRHCDEPECVKSCITGAMQKDDETGIVINDESRCIGCWTCILACPYGVVVRDYRGKKIAFKCDFCVNAGGNPACVKNCPNDALYIAEVRTEQMANGARAAQGTGNKWKESPGNGS